MGVEMKIGAVVLTYNSADDLPGCLESLQAQIGIDLRIIVVDNASNPEARERQYAIFRDHFPDGERKNSGEIRAKKPQVKSAIFIENDKNAGYSAGNNIGARLATALGCQAVLIINPDVRIKNPDYLKTLGENLLSNAEAVVAASRIKNLAGNDENPMVEPSFFQELSWPLEMLTAGLGLHFAKKKIKSDSGNAAIEKVSGSCFMIRSEFLEKIGYLDEGVFLYCEESILYSQVKRSKSRMIYVPEIEALHAHDTSRKGDPVRRYVNWCESRRYFHKNHTTYGPARRNLLIISQKITLALVKTRQFFSRLKQSVA